VPELPFIHLLPAHLQLFDAVFVHPNSVFLIFVLQVVSKPVAHEVQQLDVRRNVALIVPIKKFGSPCKQILVFGPVLGKRWIPGRFHEFFLGRKVLSGRAGDLAEQRPRNLSDSAFHRCRMKLIQNPHHSSMLIVQDLHTDDVFFAPPH
jgi:hypothetical protein